MGIGTIGTHVLTQSLCGRCGQDLVVMCMYVGERGAGGRERRGRER